MCKDIKMNIYIIALNAQVQIILNKEIHIGQFLGVKYWAKLWKRFGTS